MGEGTKFVNYITNDKKSYDVKCKLGVFSECGDFETEPISYPNEKEIINNLSKDSIKKILNSFLGDYMQIPPMFSNMKYKGKPLRNYARKNITIDRLPKKRKIYKINFLDLKDDVLSFSVTCSSGTYIRTLVQDISQSWKLHSCLYELHRSEVAPFYNYPILSPNNFSNEDLTDYIITIPEMLDDLAKIYCSDKEINTLYAGLSINNMENITKQSLCMIIDKNNNFHGVVTVKNNSIYPKRLMKR